MESVYKLSKYSQKISEACRAKQLNKVMEYNQHELAHINKLSKYFRNQKGGATVDKVVGAVGELVQAVVDDKNGVIGELRQSVEKNSKVIAQIDEAIEGEAQPAPQPAPQPAVVLQKVKDLKKKLTHIEELHKPLIERTHKLEKEIEKATAEAEVRVQSSQSAATASAELVKSKNKELVDTQAQLKAKDKELTEVRNQAEQDQLQLGELTKQLQAKDTIIAELEKTVADTKRLLEQSNASLRQLQPQNP